MHISAAGTAVAKPLSSSEKSAEVPPGLARRGLILPPGITKKIEAGGTLPEGIGKRFSAAVTPTSLETAPDISTSASETMSVSLSVAISLDITV